MLDLGYLALFVGQRINELVLEQMGPYADLRTSHGYVFQHLIEGPRTITELAARLDVSQQAASKSVTELESLGYLTVSLASDRRAKIVALSPRALAAIEHGRSVRAKLEARLAAKFELSRTKALLAEILDDLGGGDAVRGRRVREPR